MAQYTLRNLRFPVRREYDLSAEIARKLKLPPDSFTLVEIVRQAVDTRKKDRPIYDFTVLVDFPGPVPKDPDLAEHNTPAPQAEPGIFLNDRHPYIVGMGPAGLFCALALVEQGLQPVLFDRGDALEQRSALVGSFWNGGSLDPESNVQFGEGGAGAWSDGKLTSRGSGPEIRAVYELLIRFGARPEIRYQALPHLGTDVIRQVFRQLREYLTEQGCGFHYRSRLEDLELSAGKVSRLRINGDWHSPQTVVIGLGNAASDTFRTLSQRGVALEPKPFAVGFRIEQSQARIDELVYGSGKWKEILGAASYRLTAPGGYTFCMCPGGFVIAASSEAEGVVTNGMSLAARGEALCNSAVVTSVGAADFGDGLWDGLEFQRAIEKSAYQPGYLAPAQPAELFLNGLQCTDKLVGSYRPGIYSRDLGELFPPALTARLKSALISFDKVLRGFNSDALLIAPETRTSSPVRILRDKIGLNSPSAANLYPIGEGSGYAGGIISSAVDGYRLGKRMRVKGS